MRLPGVVDKVLLMIDYSGPSPDYVYVHHDWMGSTVKTTDSTGAERERFVYDPYGATDNASTGFPFRYTGQRLDTTRHYAALAP